MGDLKLTINATAAPIKLGTVGLRLPGIKGDTGDIGEISPATATTLGGIKVGENLSITESGVLSVDTASEITQGVTKPVTADAVKTAYGTLSNIDIETLINSVV